MRTRRDRNAMFDGLSERDAVRLQAALDHAQPIVGLEGLTPRRRVDPRPVGAKRGVPA